MNRLSPLRLLTLLTLTCVALVSGCKTAAVKDKASNRANNIECSKTSKNCSKPSSISNTRFAPEVERLKPTKVIKGDLSDNKKIPKDEGVNFNQIKPITISFPNKK